MKWENVLKAEWKRPPHFWEDDEGKTMYDYPFSFKLFSEANWLSQGWISNLEKFMGDYPKWTKDVVKNLTAWSNEMMVEVEDDLDSEKEESFTIEDRKGFIAHNREKFLEMLSDMMEEIFSKAISSAKYAVDTVTEEDIEEDLDIKWDKPLPEKLIKEIYKQHDKSVINAVKKILGKYKEELGKINVNIKEDFIENILTSDEVAKVFSTIYIVSQIKFQGEAKRKSAEMTEYEDEGEDEGVPEFKDKDEFDPDFTDKFTSSDWWKYIRNGVW